MALGLCLKESSTPSLHERPALNAEAERIIAHHAATYRSVGEEKEGGGRQRRRGAGDAAAVSLPATPGGARGQQARGL
eukprot:COSAG01_NODE_11351_length_1952_cov_28.873179_1_plen_77_part_10